MINTQIQYIPIKDIHPHLKNPRRDLGDLTELAESIRANGVMQNLTVVRQEEGLCGSCKQYDAAAAKCLEEDIVTQCPPCSNWKSAGKYTDSGSTKRGGTRWLKQTSPGT